MKNQKEEYDIKLRSLRQEHERVVSDMEKQVRDVKAKLRRSKPSSSSNFKRKSSSLANKNDDRSTSKFWRKKMKDLKANHKKEREGMSSLLPHTQEPFRVTHSPNYLQVPYM
ncbi:hypothetical protein OAV88_01115 [bacterium]|nr:hypothetical protein [bacterium]